MILLTILSHYQNIVSRSFKFKINFFSMFLSFYKKQALRDLMFFIIDLIQNLIMNQQQQKHQAQKSLVSKISINSQSKIDQFDEPVDIFRSAKLLAHYHQVREVHFQQLSRINMSELMKKKLFGFTQTSNLANHSQLNSLLIENHPIVGRAIMSKKRFEQRQFDRIRQAKIIGGLDAIDSSNKYSGFNKCSDSSINDQKINQNINQLIFQYDGQKADKTKARLITNTNI